jgi:virulence-associated protein VapD
LKYHQHPSLENYGASSSFLVGETVVGTFNNQKLISFRLSSSNHKEGPYNNPSRTYNINPYLIQENIPSQYSSSSKTLNVDIDSLSLEPQGLYYGYLVKGMKLVGQTSGTVAYVKDLRLISDNYGDLLGSFFFRDPLSSPPPPIRVTTGSKVYNLTSSSSNETPLPGSRLISSAETVYRAEGRWEQRQRITTTTITTFYDPLAQSFTVGGVVEAPTSGLVLDEDRNGAYLTAVDLFFANKDSNNAPVTVEIRTVELGTPTRTIVGNPVTLRQEQINISTDGTIPTKVTFDYPIYLESGREYAIVLLSPQSDQYEVWIAEMGEKTVNTSTLPDASSVRYTKQFAIGSLFLSQNGSIWTANQYQDLKFKLYKAKFANQGSVFFQNPTLSEGNGYVNILNNNPITVLPKKVSIGINTITNASLVGILTAGRKISESTKPYNYGFIVGTGSSVSSIAITNGGSNYSNTTSVDTYSITGGGKGLKLNITTTNGSITSASIVPGFSGNGYSTGDVVGIVTSSVSSSSGNNSTITISQIANGGVSIDTLYLTNVQAQSFTANGSSNLVYYDNSNNRISLATTTIVSYSPDGDIYSGNYFLVNHFEHGMHSPTNKLRIDNVLTDLPPTLLTQPLLSTDTVISVASTSIFGQFEGSQVSSLNPGYVKIEDEIIKYESVSSSGLIETITRGINSTIVLDHDSNSEVYKYEIGGVSLIRVNKTHDISDIGIEIDRYYVEFDRSNFGSNVIDRSSDASLSDTSEISFNTEATSGGSEIVVSKNIQYNSIIPHIALISPDSATSVSAQIRTISGTSVGGNEVSFIDQGYEDVELGEINDLSSVRIVCSKENEDEYLDSMFRNKSFTAKVDLSSSNPNLSPMIFWKQSSVELLGNRLNNPKMDYINDSRVKTFNNDPHSTIYVSNTVNLLQPATSLKVFVSAFRPSSSDFRVLYSLIRPDSSEIEQSFELFPGYNNLTSDFNQDGYPDVIDSSKNSGLPDTRVPESLQRQFLDYEYTASNLGEFSGYTIKIVMFGTDQSKYPIFKDIRSIAVR